MNSTIKNKKIIIKHLYYNIIYSTLFVNYKT